MDKDLQSIQEARDLIHKAKIAQADYANASQEQVDELTKAIAKMGEAHAKELGRMAAEEVGYGNAKDKYTKNILASRYVYEYIKDMKTRGILKETDRMIEVAAPVGVIAGLVPSTNPTSTVIYNSMIALKAGNAIVFSPHPTCTKCITKTVNLVREVVADQGYSPDLVSVLPIVTMQATDELMKNKDTKLVLATGGSAMVKAAYSSGTPALGVGPGNVPVFIERTADIKDAVRKIMIGKLFDNGLICASEESVVVERCIADEVKAEFERNNCYFVTGEDKDKIAAILSNSRGAVNAKAVGRTPQQLADLAGVKIPEGTKIILGCETEVGPKHPFSREKLNTTLGFYVVEDWKEGCEKCIEILNYDGLGHSIGIHTKDKNIIREFALKKPVSRMLVNTPTTLGGVGLSTDLAPAFTLGCGAVGGSATSDNVTPMNLINIKRVAFETNSNYNITGQDNSSNNGATEEVVEKVLRQILKEVANSNF